MTALGATAAEDAGFQIHAVDGYYLESSKKEPVCFSTLPLRRLGAAAADDDVPEGNNNEMLNLRGFAFAGRGRRLRVLKTVVAWRLELDGEQPEFFVLLPRADGGGGGAGGWLRLGKPAKVYERTARTALMTAQVLHFVRRNPDAPETAVWIHLRKAFRKFWLGPSEDDFRNQTTLSLMRQVAPMDPVLANSEALLAFVERISTEVGADSIDIANGEDGNNESEEDLSDSICAICDDGGELLCCDGPCMRSFHAKEGSGEDSYCETLGYTEAEVQAMKLFLCKNCEYKQHQCFICGVMEPSDGAPAKQLQPNNINEASELEKKITEGFEFTCPIHRCFHCKGLEDRTQYHLQFAVCRRCPKSYHRKCLP